MRTSIAILSSALALTAAQSNQTLRFIFPGAEGIDPVASVISANPSTTAVELSCPTNVDATDCGFGPGIRYSIISTTIYEGTLQADGVSMTLSCEHNTAKAVLTCGVDVEGESAFSPGSRSAVLSGTDVAYLTATVTAGAEMLSAGASESAAVSSSKDGGASSSAGVQPSSGLKTSVKPTASATASAGAQPSVSGPSATQSGTVSQSTTGAAVRFGVKGSALLALAGVGVTVAGVL